MLGAVRDLQDHTARTAHGVQRVSISYPVQLLSLSYRTPYKTSCILLQPNRSCHAPTDQSTCPDSRQGTASLTTWSSRKQPSAYALLECRVHLFMLSSRLRYVPYTEESAAITACGIPQNYAASKEWKDKKVVLFAVPGAFTPGCSVRHLPGYIENLEKIRGKKVDIVAVLAFNDAWVMDAWSKANGIKNREEDIVSHYPEGPLLGGPRAGRSICTRKRCVKRHRMADLAYLDSSSSATLKPNSPSR